MRCVLAMICGAAFLLSGTAIDAFERQRAPAAKQSKKAQQKASKKDTPKLCEGDESPPAPTGEELGQARRDIAAGRYAGGYVDILVRDENNKDIAGFIVSIDGKEFGRPTPFRPGFPLKEGHHKIEVMHAEIGAACMTVSVKAHDVTRATFQFFRLREKEAENKTMILPRQHHGAMIVGSYLKEWHETEVIVVPVEEIKLIGKFWLNWKTILKQRYSDEYKAVIDEHIAAREQYSGKLEQAIYNQKKELAGELKKELLDELTFGDKLKTDEVRKSIARIKHFSDRPKELSDAIEKNIKEIDRIAEEVIEEKRILEAAKKAGPPVSISAEFSNCFDVQIRDGLRLLDCGPFDARESRGSGTLKISDLAVGCYAVELRRKDGKRLGCGPADCRRVVKIRARTLVKQKQCRRLGCKEDEVPSGKVATVAFGKWVGRVVPPRECMSDRHVRAWLRGPRPST